METITKLQKRLEDAQKMLNALEAEKLEIESRMVADAKRLKEIAKEVVTIVGRKKTQKRAKNDRPLSAYIADALKDKPEMKLSDIVAEVQSAGYKSRSKNVLACVGTVLSKSEAFEKLERGLYRLAQ